MAESDLHQQVVELVRRAEAAAYERGKADAKRELLAFLGARDPDVAAMPAQQRVADVNTATPPQERQRAPKGIVPLFINKVLAAHASPERGLTPNEILARAETEFERMIQPASIRSELRNGRNAGRYHDTNGHWFLVSDDGEKEKAGDATNDTPASLSQTTEGR